MSKKTRRRNPEKGGNVKTYTSIEKQEEMIPEPIIETAPSVEAFRFAEEEPIEASVDVFSIPEEEKPIEARVDVIEDPQPQNNEEQVQQETQEEPRNPYSLKARTIDKMAPEMKTFFNHQLEIEMVKLGIDPLDDDGIEEILKANMKNWFKLYISLEEFIVKMSA